MTRNIVIESHLWFADAILLDFFRIYYIIYLKEASFLPYGIIDQAGYPFLFLIL